ncbi:hypothetical protein FSC37_23185 [Piscinibacter aquaticus]|uniref:Uncharacterized protein n=1 Tax=Piscinibacter aquaticus TaxID=392597 RepID=A0A5C6TN28_9BURK|nr:hypothetical protein FSC37_23185 [Piscinibacter aquaticus]
MAASSGPVNVKSSFAGGASGVAISWLCVETPLVVRSVTTSSNSRTAKLAGARLASGGTSTITRTSPPLSAALAGCAYDARNTGRGGRGRGPGGLTATDQSDQRPKPSCCATP